MADNYSVQAATLATADPDGWSPLETQQSGGRLRRAFFNFDGADHGDGGSFAFDETIYLCKLPANCRIYGGYIAFEDMSSGTGGADIDIGIEGFDGTGFYNKAGTAADDPDFFTGTPITADAAGTSTFNVALADPGFNYKTDKEVWVTAVVADGGAGAVVGTAALAGWIDYMQD